MFSTFRYFGSLTSLVLLVCVTSADAAGIVKGHPYRDPRAAVSAPSRYLDSGPAYWERDCCPDFGVHGTSGSSLMPSGMPGMLGRSSYGAICPPVTNALLRVWVDDCATVWVNGVRTRPQFLAGVHRGSRVFSLTGLEVDEIREVVVHAEMEGGIYVLPRQEKRELVRAGQTYEIRFDELAELEEVHPADAFQFEESHMDLPEVDEAVRRAEAAATQAEAAKRAAEAAEIRVRDVEDRVTKLIAEASHDLQRHVEQVTETAAHVASQAARSNEEAFELETGNKPFIAYVQYESDGSLAQMMFEAPTTPKALNFKETTGVHRDVQNVNVRVRFTLKIQIPDPENEGQFKDVSEVELPSESVVSFSDSIGTLDFFDRTMPEQHLSAQFKAALFEKWARSHEKGRVHVVVHAIRPNGTAVEVKVTGKPIILSLRNP